MAAEMNSGIQVRTWISRLVQVQHEAGGTHGPAFGSKYGETLGSGFIEDLVADRIQMVKDARPGLIPQEVNVYEQFGVSRTFRRGATSTARIRGVDRDTIDLVNRWRKFESAKRRQPKTTIRILRSWCLR